MRAKITFSVEKSKISLFDFLKTVDYLCRLTQINAF